VANGALVLGLVFKELGDWRAFTVAEVVAKISNFFLGAPGVAAATSLLLFSVLRMK
jgi:hypothetical protein